MINRDLNVLRKMKACLSFLFRYRKIIPDPSGLRRVVVGRTAVRLSSCGFDQFSSAYERPLTPTDAQQRPMRPISCWQSARGFALRWWNKVLSDFSIVMIIHPTTRIRDDQNPLIFLAARNGCGWKMMCLDNRIFLYWTVIIDLSCRCCSHKPTVFNLVLICVLSQW